MSAERLSARLAAIRAQQPAEYERASDPSYGISKNPPVPWQKLMIAPPYPDIFPTPTPSPGK